MRRRRKKKKKKKKRRKRELYEGDITALRRCAWLG